MEIDKSLHNLFEIELQRYRRRAEECGCNSCRLAYENYRKWLDGEEPQDTTYSRHDWEKMGVTPVSGITKSQNNKEITVAQEMTDCSHKDMKLHKERVEARELGWEGEEKYLECQDCHSMTDLSYEWSAHRDKKNYPLLLTGNDLIELKIVVGKMDHLLSPDTIRLQALALLTSGDLVVETMENVRLLKEGLYRHTFIDEPTNLW